MQDQLTICHSFWSKPCNDLRYNIEAEKHWKLNLYCFMLSCIYTKIHGCKVKFYGDKESIKKFSCIPYDEIIELNIPDNASARSWAQGKFYALKLMNLGDIHIDGDVFMKGDEIYDILRSDYDCISQGLEDQYQVTGNAYQVSRDYLKGIKFIDGCNTEVDFSYNAGVIGFKNQDFKDIYMKNYFESLEPISRLPFKEGVIPDLIVEQQHLYQMSKYYGFNVKPLLGENSLELGQRNLKLYEDAKRLRYQHVLSIYKYQQFNEIRNELLNLDSKRCRLLDLITSHISI